jgi:hypothetical protein
MIAHTLVGQRRVLALFRSLLAVGFACFLLREKIALLSILLPRILARSSLVARCGVFPGFFSD